MIRSFLGFPTPPARRPPRFALFAALLALGCAIPPETPPVSPNAGRLESALAAYAEGRYADAEVEFAAAVSDEALRRGARHGLACARIMGARTPEELASALAFRDAWQAGSAGPLGPEDPRLYGPILERLAAREPVPASPANAPEPAPPPTADPEPPAAPLPDPPPVDPAAAADLRKRLARREAENRRLRRRMRGLETELRDLREKMEAIEAIHQDIYEKKKGIEEP